MTITRSLRVLVGLGLAVTVTVATAAHADAATKKPAHTHTAKVRRRPLPLLGKPVITVRCLNATTFRFVNWNVDGTTIQFEDERFIPLGPLGSRVDVPTTSINSGGVQVSRWRAQWDTGNEWVTPGGLFLDLPDCG